jgi:hypothetical protein
MMLYVESGSRVHGAGFMVQGAGYNISAHLHDFL